MSYEKPQISLHLFKTESFLEDAISTADGEGGSSIDDSNLGDIGFEILNNIFDLDIS